MSPLPALPVSSSGVPLLHHHSSLVSKSKHQCNIQILRLCRATLSQKNLIISCDFAENAIFVMKLKECKDRSTAGWINSVRFKLSICAYVWTLS